jgi:hypothetical protein
MISYYARRPSLTDKTKAMTLLSLVCCGPSTFASLSRAAAKSAASRLRRLGVLAQARDWVQRASMCESCPVRIIHNGDSYCGRPFLHQIHREPTDGCGCPTVEKAKSPDEHCPLDWSNHPARNLPEGCTCKWCNAYGG